MNDDRPRDPAPASAVDPSPPAPRADPPPALAGRARLTAWAPLLPWLLVALALAVRLPLLDLRPAHADEGVNGWFVEKLLANGYYRYDAENYHGPLHYYLLAATRVTLGRNLGSLRLPTVLFGVAAVWLLARCGDALGRRTASLAALFLALSPAAVLYSRWAIHESELLLFSLLVFRGACRLSVRSGDHLAVWQVVGGVAGALATKEVWVMHAAALAAAFAAVLVTTHVPGWLLAWRRDRRWPRMPRLLPPPSLRLLRLALPAVVLSLLALALLYSGFGQDLDGLRRFFSPYAIWGERALEGAGHEKPWHYWLRLLAGWEPPAFAGLLALPWAVWRGPRLVRLTALYAAATLAAYSVVPYKTPWCVLQVLWPFLPVAAWALSELHRRELHHLRGRRLAGLLAGALALLSLAIALRVSFVRYDDAQEPYVYVQTYRDGLAPVELLGRLAAADPALRDQPVHVVMTLSWPIPWLLADFARTGHWRGEHLPPGDALALFIDEDHRTAVEARLTRRYLVVPFAISPVHSPARAYFDAERLSRWLPADAEVFDPATR